MEISERVKKYRVPMKAHALNGSFTIYVEYPLPNGETLRPKDGASLRALVTELTRERVVALYRSRPETASDETALAIADTDEDLPGVVYVETAPGGAREHPGAVASQPH